MRVAAWQCVPGVRDVAGNLARLDATAALAAARGAEVLVVPELFTTAYAIGPDAVRALGEPFKGPSTRRIAEIAATHRIAIAWGFAEFEEDATEQFGPYNSAGMLDREGRFLAHHRKVHLWGDVDTSQFEAGDEVAAFPLDRDASAEGHDDLRGGLLVCYDVEFAEAVRALALDGARLVLVPTANPLGCDDVQDVLLRARALENGVGLVYANYCGADERFTYNGRSMIIGPDGTVLAEADATSETLLVADVPIGTETSDYLRDRVAFRRSSAPSTDPAAP